MNALADFGTPMLIGEGFVVMPVLIYSEFVSEMGGQANFAAALSRHHGGAHLPDFPRCRNTWSTAKSFTMSACAR
jgi:hypothetical protein